MASKKGPEPAPPPTTTPVAPPVECEHHEGGRFCAKVVTCGAGAVVSFANGIAKAGVSRWLFTK